MKNILTITGICFFTHLNAQLLQQNFSSSTNLIDYISTTPNNGQWNSIGSSDQLAFPVTITNNALRFSRSITETSHFVRSSDFAPVPSTIIVQFQLTISGNTDAQQTAGNMQIGTGFNETDFLPQPIANVHSRFGINISSTPGNFALRDIQNDINSAEFSGTQIIRWVVNNSGTTQAYRSPSGTEETIDNDHWDLWVGNTRVFDEVSDATVTNPLTDIAFTFNSGTAIMDFDNFLINQIPDIPVTLTGTINSFNSFTANWTPLPNVTGYRIDAATDPSFNNILPAYDNFYLDGAATSSVLLTNLQSNTTYYYRVRAATQFTIDEFQGGNSLVLSVSLVSLPLTLLDFRVDNNNFNHTLLNWTTTDEKDLADFVIQKSNNGINFDSIGWVKAKNIPSTTLHYQFTDPAVIHGTLYYRLKMVDIDGRFRYSRVVSIVNDQYDGFTLMQNPVGNTLLLRHPSLPGSADMLIYDLNGKTVLRGTTVPNSVMSRVDVLSILPGAYVLKLYMDGRELFVSRFLKTQ